MFEDFIITQHIVDRYLERTKCLQKDVMRRIKKDLHFTKVKKIVNIGDVRHVFTHHSKEFIFVRDGSKWILRTIIKRKRCSNELAIQKRLEQSSF